ncbi:MAG: hypothetical protein ACJ76Z_05605 [Thermoleophilaceae bacterium]
MRASLTKCLSLGDASPLRVERHPHDYRHHGNREYLFETGTTWVRLWVSWYDLQASFRPASRAESWAQLDGAPGDLPAGPPFSPEPALRNLDRQIAAANADGVSVILAIDELTPPWANSAGDVLPAGVARYGDQQDGAHPPLDRSTSGPWAWFIEHLCARYSPKPATGGGNPDGAYIAALELFHEPNLRWPQDVASAAVAEMLRSAAAIAASHDGLLLLAPSLSDVGVELLDGPWGPGTPLGLFAQRLLADLDGWDAPVHVAWSQHHYWDLGRAETKGVQTAARLLRDSAWPDPTRSIWLTEGAVATPDPRAFTSLDALEHEQLQAALIRLNYEQLARRDDIRLWTYHTIHDTPLAGARTGLRGDFDWEHERAGAEKLACVVFAELPGDRFDLSELDRPAERPAA